MALIEVANLRKTYRMGDTQVRALDGVDLTIEAGEFIAITGASGSGKSTMMHLLGCLDRPSSGTYKLDGREVSRLSDRALAELRNRSIGFVFQTFNLVNRTSALENVGMPLFYARKRSTGAAARKALERVGLGQRVRHRPNELSGGERQRVAIARAIVNDPLLLFADEPTGNLDTRTGEQIMSIFHDLNARGVTVVLVTHEPDIAAQARRVIHMRDGKIVSDSKQPSVRDASGGGAVEAAPVARTVTVGEIAPAPLASQSPLVERPVHDRDPVPVARRQAAGADADAPPIGAAIGAMRCGIFALVAGLTFLGLIIAIPMIAPAVSAKPQPGQLPNLPGYVWGMLGATLLAFLGTVIGGLVAGFWGLKALRRLGSSPDSRSGARQARLGAILGWASALLPLGVIAVREVAARLR